MEEQTDSDEDNLVDAIEGEEGAHDQYNYPIEQGRFAAIPLNCIAKRAIIKWSNTWC